MGHCWLHGVRTLLQSHHLPCRKRLKLSESPGGPATWPGSTSYPLGPPLGGPTQLRKQKPALKRSWSQPVLAGEGGAKREISSQPRDRSCPPSIPTSPATLLQAALSRGCWLKMALPSPPPAAAGISGIPNSPPSTEGKDSRQGQSFTLRRLTLHRDGPSPGEPLLPRRELGAVLPAGPGDGSWLLSHLD